MEKIFMHLSVTELKDNLVEFKVHPILNAKTLWINNEKLFALDGNYWSSDRFLKIYAYGIKGNQFFDDIVFDESKSKTLVAEIKGVRAN